MVELILSRTVTFTRVLLDVPLFLKGVGANAEGQVTSQATLPSLTIRTPQSDILFCNLKAFEVKKLCGAYYWGRLLPTNRFDPPTTSMKTSLFYMHSI